MSLTEAGLTWGKKKPFPSSFGRLPLGTSNSFSGIASQESLLRTERFLDVDIHSPPWRKALWWGKFKLVFMSSSPSPPIA